MTKISLLPNDSAPVGADILAGVETSIDTTENFKLSDLLTYIKNNIAAVSYNPYSFDVYRSAALSLAGGIVIFDTKNYDTGSNYSTTTGLFTATIAGKYHFDTQIWTTTSTAYFNATFYKNGSVYRYVGGTADTQAQTISGGGIDIELNGNDTIGVCLNASTTCTMSVGNSFIFFGGFLISAT